jgi:hypothetical protein
VKNQKTKTKALLWRKTKAKTPSGELNVQLAQRQRQKLKNKAIMPSGKLKARQQQTEQNKVRRVRLECPAAGL